MTRVAVLPAGNWGTAFGMICAESDEAPQVTLWARREEAAREIREDHRNSRYLPGVDLPATMTATSDVREALAGADVVVLAVPSQTLRENLEAWREHLPADAIYVSLMKGIELGTTRRMSQVVHDVGGVPLDRIAVVSGPNLAKEIVRRDPAAAVVASADPHTAERVAALCATDYFRPYTNTDVIGTELGGAVKNVVALAVGMAEGLGLGDNSKASIITRGLAETSRLGVALGADPQTFAGLAGVGDLIATCMSPLSRNHSFGVRLGQGMSVEEVVAATKETAEGVKSCRSIFELAQAQGVDMPIVQMVVAVVDGRLQAEDVTGLLMSRARKSERH